MNTNHRATEIKETLDAIKKCSEDNLLKCCKELKAFSITGILCNGIVRGLTLKLQEESHCDFGSSLTIVKNIIHSHAIDFVISDLEF